MNTKPTPQQRLDTAFENYFELSRILREDVKALLDCEVNSQHWRRNFIRASASLIEGHVHCLKEMCVVSFECDAPKISKKEREVLQSEGNFSANERIRLTLRAAYKLFELQPAPEFGDNEWPKAKGVMTKRHLLMHPKNAANLDISEELWLELRAAVTWLFEQLFNFMSLLQKKHTG